MKNEPAVVIGAIVSLVVALGAIFGVVIDGDTLEKVITSAIPLVTGLLTRGKVSPAAKSPQNSRKLYS